MKKLILAGCLFFLGIGITSTVSAADFGYPFVEIAKPACRKDAWSTLGADCKMALPRIVGADYQKYKGDTQFRRIYTVLWGATYDYGWDVGLGSHMGVDIATSAGTPVLSIADGTVVKSDFNSGGWGNYVTIKHTLADKTVIYSNYAHLSAKSVNKGDIVRLGQQIGEVGNTGNSYGNHLHFQIDITDQLHPYYFVTCAKGKNELTVVNTGDCRSYLVANTIDPIAFLETGATGVVPPTGNVIEQIKNKPVIVIEKKSIKSREEILNEEAEEYLKSYILTVNMPSRGTTVAIGSAYEFSVDARDFNKNLSPKNLPGAGVKITVDTKKATVFPDNFTQLNGGIRNVSITPKATGPIDLVFTIGKREIGRKRIYGIAKGSKVVTNDSETLTVKKGYLGQEYDFYVSPLGNGGYYVGTNAYNERYRIEVTKGKAKFCLNVPPAGSACDSSMVVEMIEFSKKDTPNGFFGTRVIPLSSGTIEIRVSQVGKPGANVSKISTDLPIGLDRRHPYYDTIVAGLSKNWWNTRGGYVGQDQEMTTEMTKEFITRILDYQVLKAGMDKTKKQAAINNRELFLRSSKSLASKKWGRAEFADLLLKSLRIPTVKRDAVWNDESGTYQDTMATLRSKYQFRWQDPYGERYFQADKAITVAEALYLASQVVK